VPGAHPFGSDVQSILQACGAGSKVMVSYMFAGIDQLKGVAASNQAELREKLLLLADSNGHEYQDELTQLIVFGYRCTAQVVPPMTEFIKSFSSEQMIGARQDGLNQSRNGIISMFQGAAVAVADTEISEHNKTAMLSALAENASVLSQTLTISQRQRVLHVFESVRLTIFGVPESLLDKIIDTLKDSRCEGLCAVSPQGAGK
jgi:hypothetical protein